jgi:hypothetical protein
MEISNEEQLLRELDRHDQLVAKYAGNELSFEQFERAYDRFYPDAAGLFVQHAARIAFHREVWKVLDQVVPVEVPSQQHDLDSGWIRRAEAHRQISELVRTQLELQRPTRA